MQGQARDADVRGKVFRVAPAVWNVNLPENPVAAPAHRDAKPVFRVLPPRPRSFCRKTNSVCNRERARSQALSAWEGRPTVIADVRAGAVILCERRPHSELRQNRGQAFDGGRGIRYAYHAGRLTVASSDLVCMTVDGGARKLYAAASRVDETAIREGRVCPFARDIMPRHRFGARRFLSGRLPRRTKVGVVCGELLSPIRVSALTPFF